MHLSHDSGIKFYLTFTYLFLIVIDRNTNPKKGGKYGQKM